MTERALSHIEAVTLSSILNDRPVPKASNFGRTEARLAKLVRAGMLEHGESGYALTLRGRMKLEMHAKREGWARP
jgi:hypothetical protein